MVRGEAKRGEPRGGRGARRAGGAEEQRPSLAARRRAFTEGRIVEAALEVVAREGLEALTMGRLGEVLGCAPGGLYRYFASKDALLVALAQVVVASLAADVDRALARLEAARLERHAPPRQAALVRLIVQGEAWVTLGERRPAHLQLVLAALGDPRQLVSEPADEAALRAAAGLLARFSGALADAGAPPRPGATAALIAAPLGALQLRKLERFGALGLATLDLARLAFDATLAGLGIGHDRITRARERLAAAGGASLFDDPTGATP